MTDISFDLSQQHSTVAPPRERYRGFPDAGPRRQCAQFATVAAAASPCPKQARGPLLRPRTHTALGASALDWAWATPPRCERGGRELRTPLAGARGQAQRGFNRVAPCGEADGNGGPTGLQAQRSVRPWACRGLRTAQAQRRTKATGTPHRPSRDVAGPRRGCRRRRHAQGRASGLPRAQPAHPQPQAGQPGRARPGTTRD
jgi:hypothetical protein